MKIAIFGAGGIARKAYLPLLASWPEVEIGGLFSRTQSTVDQTCAQWHIDFGTTDFDALVEKKPQAAFVLTNNATHYEFAKMLLKAGIDVFVEKPAASTTAEMSILANLADENKRIFMVGFNRRYDLFYQQAKQLFKDKKIQLAIFEKHRDSAFHVSLYNNFVDDTIHQIDLMRHICGEVSVLSTQQQILDGKLVGAVSLTRIPDGGLAVLMTSLKAGSWQERVSLHGENLSVEVDAFRQLKVKYPEREEVYGCDRPGKWIEDMKERGFYGSVAHFLDCVRTRKQPLTSGQDALKTHELIDALVEKSGEFSAKPKADWDNVPRWESK